MTQYVKIDMMEYRAARDELAQRNLEHINDMKVMGRQGEELTQARAELADARRVALSYLRMATKRKKELAQAQRQLATPDQKCAYCGYRYSAGTNAENFAVMAEHIKSCPKHPLAKALAELAQAQEERVQAQIKASQLSTKLADACAAQDALARECNELEADREYNAALVIERDRELAQARDELKYQRGANQVLARQVARVTRNRDFWYEKALDAEAERDQIRSEAQEQSDEVQRDWLSPCQKAGLEALVKTLRRQLTDADTAMDAVQSLWHSPAEAKRLRRQLKHAEDAHTYRFKEYDALEIDLCHAAEGEAAIVEAAEALVKCLLPMTLVENEPIFYCAFSKLKAVLEHRSDAAAKLLERLAGAKRSAEVLEQERDEWRLSWENVTADLLNTRERLAEAELAAHVHDKACGELAQTAHTERALRQVAETSERASRKMLARQCDMARTAETEAMKAKRQLAEAERRANKAVNQLSRAGEREHQAEQRAERAEAELEQVRDWLAIQKQGRDGDRDKLLGRTAMLDTVEAALQAERQLCREAEQRAENREAELINGHKALTAADIMRSDASGYKYSIAGRVVRLHKAGQRAEALAASAREAVEWLWGFWDGNTLVAKPGYKDDIREAWDRLLAATDGEATVSLLGRLEEAEALAALVTPELANLLEILGKDGWPGVTNKAGARRLAAQIREALDGDKT